MVRFLVLVIALFGWSQAEEPIPRNKSIVKYLGTDFVLWSGCPKVQCDENNRARGGNECAALEQEYNECMK